MINNTKQQLFNDQEKVIELFKVLEARGDFLVGPCCILSSMEKIYNGPNLIK